MYYHLLGVKSADSSLFIGDSPIDSTKGTKTQNGYAPLQGSRRNQDQIAAHHRRQPVRHHPAQDDAALDFGVRLIWDGYPIRRISRCKAYGQAPPTRTILIIRYSD